MRFVTLLLGLLAALPALARGLDDGDRIDQVHIHATTGQPALILSVDKPVDSEPAEKQLDYKLGTYIGFVRSKDIYSRYPKANPGEKPLIIFIFEFPPSTKVRSMLFGARERLLEMGFEVWLKVYDETSKRNVDIAP
jgi:hypothetical protein